MSVRGKGLGNGWRTRKDEENTDRGPAWVGVVERAEREKGLNAKDAKIAKQESGTRRTRRNAEKGREQGQRGEADEQNRDVIGWHACSRSRREGSPPRAHTTPLTDVCQ